MCLETQRFLSFESKRLEQEAKKMNVIRLKNSNEYNQQFVETDESLINRMYCVWFSIQPRQISLWDMSDEKELVWWSKYSPGGVKL